MIAAIAAAVRTTSVLRLASNVGLAELGWFALTLGDEGVGEGQDPVVGASSGASTKATGFVELCAEIPARGLPAGASCRPAE